MPALSQAANSAVPELCDDDPHVRLDDLDQLAFDLQSTGVLVPNAHGVYITVLYSLRKMIKEAVQVTSPKDTHRIK